MEIFESSKYKESPVYTEKSCNAGIALPIMFNFTLLGYLFPCHLVRVEMYFLIYALPFEMNTKA
jgi:hypothetical protein